MNDTSSSFCAMISSGVFSRRASVGDGLASCARPVASVVAVKHRLAVAADHLDARALDRQAACGSTARTRRGCRPLPASR